jgi:hypothetical protein
MAIIQCSECGRAVSSLAEACIGCGAPLGARPFSPNINLVPQPSVSPPPTARQLRRRAWLAAALLLAGVIAAAALQHRRHDRIAATCAALLLISGLCWCIVTILQAVASRR